MLRLVLSRLLLRCLIIAERRRVDVDAIVRTRAAERRGLAAPCYESDLYDAARDEGLWRSYRNALLDGPERSEIALRAHTVRDAVLPLPAARLINFGSGFGWLEHQVAKARPELQVIGIDRRQAGRNNAAFKAPNLMFADVSDITALFDDRPEWFAEAIFTAVNTLHIFARPWIADLFSALRDAGCRHVVLWEPSGISAETGRRYRYGATPRPSEVYYGQTGGAVIMHNYPALLAGAGFSVVRLTRHRWPDPSRHGHAPVMVVASRR